ncbi:MAG: CRISPR-associated helicase Cas3' [Gammaproteobacteria bacterium]|nr:CRISPR-associated helicase Cas3' [Gammaproteobacteria bacterium]
MTNSHTSHIAQYWPGKSDTNRDSVSYHPTLWHMLDVGAVAKEICRRTSLTGDANQDIALCFFVALHDLGKISNSFREMMLKGTRQHWRHWEHSAILLLHHDDKLNQLVGGTKSIRKELIEAVAGHHGGPRILHDKFDQQMRNIGDKAIDDAGQTIKLIGSCFEEASLHKPLPQGISWLLNGLTIQSDWIGSDQNWFMPESPNIPLEEYWIKAQKKAIDAVTKTRLYSANISKNSARNILDSDFDLRPMQKKVLNTPLQDGPVLAIIEDTTGAGKTEAALILCKRMMATGKGEGIFISLPTMATANAMLDRIEKIALKMFDGPPTLALSHGRAKQSDIFRRIKARAVNNPEDGPHCGDWLSADRRRILLADIGVGTIDQALLSVLPTRFNGLRLRALSKRILVVDEAHSYEPYMQEQLERLLMMQAKLGGSMIIITATLPIGMKTKFISSFQKGLQDKPPRRNRQLTPVVGIDAYPALTIVGKGEELDIFSVPASSERTIQVSRISEFSQAIDLLQKESKKGAACIWIRNAVDDAIAAVMKLRDIGIESDLLHARFSLCDRLRQEEILLEKFGRKGKGRRGRILVATQVVEQSLDLDFDMMISDLCPIGSLIQRAGRLWRHMDIRPSRPIDGLKIHVLSPDPDHVPNAKWVHEVLDKGSYIYPPSIMWRSARAIFDTKEIRSPSGLRELIEAVEGDTKPDVPEALEEDDFGHEGQLLVETMLARNALIDPFSPFNQSKMANVWDDEKYPTRIGIPQVTLALATEGQNGLQPYGKDWEMSEVQISKHKYNKLNGPDQNDKRISSVKENWTEARQKYIYLVPLGKDGQICAGLKYDKDLGIIFGD